nr:GPN-loop GTPase 3 [Andalucia godoyi]|eukprot:ANDGO_06155.mRNA.1 GPN-loop GTPase 3
MGKYAQFIIGPAGSGKSTYCAELSRYLTEKHRKVHCVNLDPAAHHLAYEPSIDIRELVTTEDLASELSYGPNGALLAAFEYLGNNMDWFEEEVSDFSDDYLLIDCPGQIELYAHIPVMRSIGKCLRDRMGYFVCAVCLIDASFVADITKFVAGSLVCLSAMCSLELPHINVVSKCDLLPKGVENEELQRLLSPDKYEIAEMLDQSSVSHAPGLRRLHEQMAGLLDEFSLVSFIPLNIRDDESVEHVLYQADQCVQFGEDEEPKESDFFPPERDGDDGDDAGQMDAAAQFIGGGGFP